MKSYSLDLRERIVASRREGKNLKWIVETFHVSISSVKRYIRQEAQTGSVAPINQRLRGEYEKQLAAQVARMNDATLEAHVEEWNCTTGMHLSQATMCQALQRIRQTRKRTIGATERDEVARMLFRDLMQTLSAKQLVIVDESSTHLHMYPRYARASCGQCAYAQHKRNYGQNISLLAALQLDGMGAALVVLGGVNHHVFEAYIQQLLLPTLKQGDMVILDNLPAHHASSISAILRTKQCRVLFLPAYSPDLSPIEAAFAKIKQALRKTKADTFDALSVVIDTALQQISPNDAIGFFSSCGFADLDCSTDFRCRAGATVKYLCHNSSFCTVVTVPLYSGTKHLINQKLAFIVTEYAVAMSV